MRTHFKPFLLIAVLGYCSPALANFSLSIDEINSQIDQCYQQTVLVSKKVAIAKITSKYCSAIINSGMLSRQQKAINLFNRGIIVAYQGHYELAAKDFENAIKYAPGLLEAHVAAAQLHGTNHQFAQSLRYYDSALALDNQNQQLKRNREFVAKHVRKYNQVTVKLSNEREHKSRDKVVY